MNLIKTHTLCCYDKTKAAMWWVLWSWRSHYCSDPDSSVLYLDGVMAKLQVICVINLHYTNNECKGRAQRECTNSIAKHSDKGGAVMFLAFSTLPNTYHFESLWQQLYPRRIVLLNALSCCEYFLGRRGVTNEWTSCALFSFACGQTVHLKR